MTVKAKPINLRNPILSRLILSGNFVWAFLVNLCAISACVHLPIFSTYPWILAACLGVVGYFVIALRPLNLSFKGPLALLLSFVTILVLIGPYLFSPRFFSRHLDSWYYCAFAEYIARFATGASDGLAPLYQWASHLSATRYGTSSILAFLGGATRLDAIETLPICLVLVFLNIFWGIALLARTLGCGPWMAVAAGGFSVLCGLIPDAIIAAGFDNLLFLSILPCLVIRIRLHRFGNGSLRSSAGLACSFAATVYSYPEGALLAAVIFFPVFLCFFSRAFKASRWLVSVSSVALLALVFLSPYLTILPQFLRNQFALGVTGLPGAGMFPGFFLGGVLPAIFGAGSEWVGTSPSWIGLAYGAICLLFIVAAVPRLTRRRPDIVASLGFLLLLVGWQGYLLRYAYGLFKVMNIGAVATNSLLFLGIQQIPRRYFVGWMCSLDTVVAVGLTIIGAAERRANIGESILVATPKIRQYAILRKVSQFVGESPVLLLIDNGFDQAWAVYFLRDAPVTVDAYRGYLGFPFLRELMSRARPVRFPPEYVLSNSERNNPIWKNGKFWLSASSKVEFGIVDSPNGIESMAGKPFVWLGNQPVQFFVEAKEACSARFHCVDTVLGPSLPNNNERSICIRTGDSPFQRLRVRNGFSANISLDRGGNKIAIWDEDRPSISKLPSGDMRVLLLGLRDYRIDPSETPNR